MGIDESTVVYHWHMGGVRGHAWYSSGTAELLNQLSFSDIRMLCRESNPDGISCNKEWKDSDQTTNEWNYFLGAE